MCSLQEAIVFDNFLSVSVFSLTLFFFIMFFLSF